MQSPSIGTTLRKVEASAGAPDPAAVPYGEIFRQSAAGMAVVVDDGARGFRIVDYNRAAEGAIGRDGADNLVALGCRLEEVLPGIEALGVNVRIREALATGRRMPFGALEYESEGRPTAVFSGEFIPLDESNVLISFENIADPLFSGGNRSANDSDLSLEDLALRVARELREPVSNVKLAAELLYQDRAAALDHPATDYVAHIRSSVGHMKERIEDVLTLSRLQGDLIPFREVNLTGLIRAVVADRRLEIEATGARVDVGRLVTVKGDASLLRHLFSNLLSNALKFRREGVRPEILIRYETETRPPGEVADTVRISVADNGIGFSRDLSQHIFTMFRTVAIRPSAYMPGLSLAICRLIVERHGGRIWATGAPGIGARFTMELPLH